MLHLYHKFEQNPLLKHFYLQVIFYSQKVEKLKKIILICKNDINKALYLYI
jgi:hypothetical protein